VSFAQAPPSIVEADRLEPAGLALPAGQVLELHLVAQVRGAPPCSAHSWRSS
jgi:hypothetical protein